MHPETEPVRSQEPTLPPKPPWFQVAGDVDDFIFYFEPEKPVSQR